MRYFSLIETEPCDDCACIRACHGDGSTPLEVRFLREHPNMWTVASSRTQCSTPRSHGRKFSESNCCDLAPRKFFGRDRTRLLQQPQKRAKNASRQNKHFTISYTPAMSSSKPCASTISKERSTGVFPTALVSLAPSSCATVADSRLPSKRAPVLRAPMFTFRRQIRAKM